MANSSSSSKPSTEQRIFNVPELEPDEFGQEIFAFLFTIELAKPKPKVSFTISLHEDLAGPPSGEASASPPQPVEYKFNGDSSDFVFIGQGGYYVRGNIQIIYLSQAQGNFYGNRCNFNFDLEYGKAGENPAKVVGLFSLEDPAKPAI